MRTKVTKLKVSNIVIEATNKVREQKVKMSTHYQSWELWLIVIFATFYVHNMNTYCKDPNVLNILTCLITYLLMLIYILSNCTLIILICVWLNMFFFLSLSYYLSAPQVT